jgi:hypothetical protein
MTQKIEKKISKSRDLYLASNRAKRRYRVYTFAAMRKCAEDMAEKLYGKKSFSLACHMALYKDLRAHGFIDLRKLLTEHKNNRVMLPCS